MANIYLKLIQDGKLLPDAYRAMGSPQETWRNSKTGVAVTGWEVSRLLYKMNEDGDDWWSNDLRLVVDEHGSLWEIWLSEGFDRDSGRTSSVSLKELTGENLRSWHVNSSDTFDKVVSAVEAML